MWRTGHKVEGTVDGRKSSLRDVAAELEAAGPTSNGKRYMATASHLEPRVRGIRSGSGPGTIPVNPR
jgi:hypothetical protein